MGERTIKQLRGFVDFQLKNAIPRSNLEIVLTHIKGIISKHQVPVEPIAVLADRKGLSVRSINKVHRGRVRGEWSMAFESKTTYIGHERVLYSNHYGYLESKVRAYLKTLPDCSRGLI